MSMVRKSTKDSPKDPSEAASKPESSRQRRGAVMVTAEVPPELRKALRMRALENGETVRDLIVRALERELSGGGNPL